MVACVETGRRGVAIEKDPEYFEMTCTRVRRTVEQIEKPSIEVGAA